MATALTPLDIIGVGRARLHRIWLYADDIIYRLRPHPTTSIQTLSVDKHWRIHFNPAFVTKVGVQFIATFFAHEVLHMMLRHAERLSPRTDLKLRYERVRRFIIQRIAQATDWQSFINCTADYEVNGIVDGANLPWPEGFTPLRAEQVGLPTGKGCIWYTEELLRLAEADAADESTTEEKGDADDDGNVPQPGGAGAGEDEAGAESGAGGAGESSGGEGGGGEGEGSGEVGEAANADEPDDAGSRDGEGDADADARGEGGDEESGDERDGAGEADASSSGVGADAGGAGNPEPNVGGGCCGGCAGNEMPHEMVDDDGMPDPVSQMEQALARRMVAQSIIESAASGKGSAAGSVLMDWAQTMLAPPKVRWQDVLANRVRGVVSNVRGTMDRKYGPVSRVRTAMVAAGFGQNAPILPAMRGGTPRVTFGVDVSGSMGTGKDSLLHVALSEAWGLTQAARAEVFGMSIDAKVQVAKRIKTKADILSLAQGHGGTDMRLFFKSVADEKRQRPHIAILLTDGETDWPTAHEGAKDVQFIILLIAKPYCPLPDFLKPMVINVK